VMNPERDLLGKSRRWQYGEGEKERGDKGFHLRRAAAARVARAVILEGKDGEHGVLRPFEDVRSG